ncbi:MAG: carboxypeptidase regulatory-like domain-containing protein [Theionarchaea archaeon]|nr:carboxypeptidase regulatory-like domain-containing protein [Theionarchaea archaeon]MBU7001037.1 carboxypeptidase regulatory-like domain-containing protein [Theionarchaea archaeon]MBU7020526.1 carboxypeptidase regulatory-like domain-containing protein [Theionarchaea archaeon]MBU7034207.1 carboxypeptidase regulatory-like domain-containing protein [Theionarchaea archaeon]MBU7039819.1 carboxypeptidase regulatory-like domain-containing protein [Theionarchaea archaeon]
MTMSLKGKVVISSLAFLLIVSVVDIGAYVAAPTIKSPTIGATGVSCTPLLKWETVVVASSYELQLSKYTNFSVNVVEKSVNNNYYQVTSTLDASTKYYWRVRTISYDDLSLWSTAYFTTGTCSGESTTTLSAPTLVSPANNTSWTQNLYPTFQWQAVTGATSYTIQISRSTDFTSTYKEKEATVYNTYYIIDTALTNCSSYYWRVRALNSDGSGSWSSTWKFTILFPPSQPILTSPTSGAVVTIRRPAFTWESSTGATAYTIEIDGATYSVSTTTFTPYSNLSTGAHTWRVRATSCGGGQNSDWSQSRTFTIDLNDVVLKKPANNSTVTTATPTFEWGTVEGATKYKLEVRKSTVDGTKVFEVEVTGTSFTPTAILNPGVYIWRVMSYMSDAWTGSWSSQPFTFTVETAGALTAPQLQSPTNGSTVDFPLNIRWSSVTSAYSYTLEYSRDTDFDDSTSVTLYGTEYTVSSELDEGRWYWHVKANNSQGDSGPWSTTWSFEVGLPVPQLTSPDNGSTQGMSSVTFDWSDVTGSQIEGQLYDLSYYVLQYSTSSTFESQSTISISSSGGSPLRESRYGPINLGDGTYHWRVMAVYVKYPEGTLREGSWSTAYSFTISTGGSSVPTLVSPIAGSIMKGTRVTLAWSPIESTGITGYVLVYMKGSSTNPGNPSQWTSGSYTEVIITGQATSSYSVTLEENTQDKPYYWWAIATVNSSGQKGTFPSPINFSIDNTPPSISTVELVQPVNTTLAIRIPTFTWRIPLTSYQDVSSWTLEYASDTQLQENRRTISGLTNLSTIISGDKASISYTLPSSQALTNGTWYWHISAADPAGNVSTFTAVVSFVVNAGEEEPAKVALVSPPNGFEDTPSRPTFSWLQVQGATTYHLQVDGNSNFSSPEIDQENLTTTSFMATSELESGTYYWRVNSNAPNPEWSDVWSFEITGEAPPQVVLLSPSSGAQNMPPTPVFQWQSLEGASTYTLEVSTTTSFSTTLVNKSGLTTTTWGTASDWEANTPSELESGTYYWRVSSNLSQTTSAIWNFTVPGEEGGGTITYTVVLSDLNGDPVSGASVTLSKDNETVGTTTTDTSGRAVIGDLESGTYTVAITASGYSGYSETISLSSSTTKNVTLYRGAVIHGYVYYDNTQNPAANVAVRIYDTETQLQVVSDITDTSGYFAVDNITDNKTYYIIVENYEDQKKQGIVPVDAPTTANALTIIVKTEGEIIGVIQDEEGAPLPGAKITLRDSQGQFVNSTSSSNIGSFNFKVTPGQFYVEVTLPGYEDYRGDLFTVEYKEVEDLGLITLLSKTGSLVINVQSSEGMPLEATITVKDEAGNIVDSFSVSGTSSVEVSVGTYTLEATAEGYEAQMVSNITIESGTTVSQDFVLSPAAGSIKVYVTDIAGMPLVDTEVFLDGESVGTTDDAGTLVVGDVSPEEHTISVHKEGYVDHKEIQTLNPGESLILELALDEAGLPLTYVVIPIVIAALGGAIYYFMKSRGGEPTMKERKPSSAREKTRIPTGVRKEGLPRRSFRGR